MKAELAVNIEPRRKGEVSVGVVGDGRVPGFAWVSAAEARSFGFALLAAARDAEDMVESQ